MTKKKNIGIFIGQLFFGGSEKQSILLTKGLADFHTVYFIVFKGHRIEYTYIEMLKAWNIPYFILEGNIIAKLSNLYSLLRRKKIDILFCYLPLDNILGTLIGRISGVKYIIGGIRNTKIVKKKFYFLKFIQNHFQDFVIFNSNKAKELFCARGYKDSKCLVIENAIADELSYHIRPNVTPVKILMVGRFVRQKDYKTGIKTISHLYYNLNCRNIKLVIAGFGEMEDAIRNWITSYNLFEITEIHIKPDYLPSLYSSSDVFFNSSLNEGLSNSIMEAMANGMPVVATNTGDIKKQIIHGESGFISEVGDYESLGQQLKTLCENYSTRIAFGQVAHRITYQEFGFDCFQKRYLSFVNSLK